MQVELCYRSAIDSWEDPVLWSPLRVHTSLGQFKWGNTSIKPDWFWKSVFPLCRNWMTAAGGQPREVRCTLYICISNHGQSTKRKPWYLLALVLKGAQNHINAGMCNQEGTSHLWATSMCNILNGRRNSAASFCWHWGRNREFTRKSLKSLQFW